MIKLAYVINYITNNGPSRVILDIIKYLDKETFNISLITLFPENKPEIISFLKENGIKIYECKTLSRRKCLQGKSQEFNKIIKGDRGGKGYKSFGSGSKFVCGKWCSQLRDELFERARS